MISRADKISKLFKLGIEFLGGRVLVQIGGSIGLGLIVFAVELLMAFSIQSFFLSLGLLESSPKQHWMNELLGIQSSLNEAIVLLLVVGTFPKHECFLMTINAKSSSIRQFSSQVRIISKWLNVVGL